MWSFSLWSETFRIVMIFFIDVIKCGITNTDWIWIPVNQTIHNNCKLILRNSQLNSMLLLYIDRNNYTKCKQIYTLNNYVTSSNKKVISWIEPTEKAISFFAGSISYEAYIYYIVYYTYYWYLNMSMPDMGFNSPPSIRLVFLLYRYAYIIQHMYSTV